MSKKQTEIYVVSHTHWDREWYQDFEGFRERLVNVMNDLLDNLAADDQYRVFHLDGQTIVLRDYLEICPQREPELRRFIQEGRIVIGPWYVMPDEFLVSGESLIKNLQTGMAICREYGVQPMNNGYVTDIFGHNSQFPQILRQFGIDGATLYRGIGDYPKDAFCWRSPDGSEVVVAKLDRERSYSNYYFAARWPYEQREMDQEDAVRRMGELLEYSLSLNETGHILMMDGVDHIGMDPATPAMIALFNERFKDVHFQHAYLEDFFEQVKKQKDAMEVIEGPLYNLAEQGGNNSLLKNVLSSAVYLKQANDRCETLLTRNVQPLDAFLTMVGQADVSRRGYMEKAWDYVLQNQPHDSICGCSISDVHRDNEYRFRHALAITDNVRKQEMTALAAQLSPAEGDATGSILLFNPADRRADGVNLVRFAVAVGHQNNLRFYDPEGREIAVQCLDTQRVGEPCPGVRRLIGFKDYEWWTAAVDAAVPANGYTALTYKDVRNEKDEYAYAFTDYQLPKRLTGSLMTASDEIDNGVYTIRLQHGGTIHVTDKRTGRVYDKLLTFEDTGDVGEGWNYIKPKFDNKYFLTGGNVEYSVQSDGPLACVIKITHRHRLPAAAESMERRSGDLVPFVFDTYVTVVKDSATLHFRTVLHNNLSAHRLRVLFPTAYKTDVFYTKTPFDMQRWPVSAGDYGCKREEETFVHPSQGVTYVTDGACGMSVFAKGLYEVELTDNAERAVALTLFRAPHHKIFGRGENDQWVMRDLSFEYALRFGDTDASQALAEGEQWRAGLDSQFIEQSHGTLPRQASFLTCGNDHIRVSLFARETLEDGREAMVLRLYQVTDTVQEAAVTLVKPIKEAYTIDFSNQITGILEVADDAVRTSVPPHGIVTIAVLL